MKTNRIFLALMLLSFVAWGCTSQDDLASGSLKSSLKTSAQSLTTAMNSITSTAGYQVLSAQGGSVMMVKQSTVAFDSTYNQILLADVAGKWDYKAASFTKCSPDLLRFFVNSGSSSNMVVSLPESKIKNPKSLLHYLPSDTLLTNNYVIDVSKYAYHFKPFVGWDYDMASNISISGTSLGDLNIQSSNDKTSGYHFNSGFTFANGYVASASYTSGDTIVSTYNISKDNTTLYQEKYIAIRSNAGFRHSEKTYSLTIGNVEIVRQAGPNSLDSAEVYVGGVLQLNSKVQFVDNSATAAADGTEVTVTKHNRQLQITFDDGTTTTIETLLNGSIDNIRTLFASIRQTYFATSIVDWVAWDIYKNK